MMDIPWGEPFALIDSKGNDVARVGTIETAHHWLRRKWPVADGAQKKALLRVEAAMDCMGSVDEARQAFLLAARSAGFVPARRA
ncbi:DUF982 domain-containing protein [Pseudooceanicola sp. CBS1P-1]|uniref:DUF982 domain-containing protein n=1 Tax=Pseudooceanicola albus TaxID=2692189 RepID=A0A6L7GC39_9RHOB|nr:MULTISPECIES: DUF982 domain-containing protein [Pseudooceanicola]MBT9386324.1 DUF982 domain-containing protein [Pseudooceanicola endophyticus]MXN20373.1 DUF982 domain-containing protein [Pseudooceanicola albus]